MSAGDRLLDASGNVILDASGNIQGSRCSICSTFEPTQITATFNSITTCSGCISLSGGIYGKFDSGSPNGTFCLTRNSACHWNKATTGLIFKLYTDSGCTSLLHTEELFIIFAVSSTGWGIKFISSSVDVFSYRECVAPDADLCIHAGTYSNLLTPCGIGYSYGLSCDSTLFGVGAADVVGIGGTVTISNCC